MDPIAHTLVGASLARTRLGRLSALAAPTLILGANAPDLDAVTMFIDRDLSLGFRRGWTHGVLALAVLPLLLTALVCLVDRCSARLRGRPPRARPGPLLGLACLAVASHPALDWLNTYGVRFLMPFDGRWFYGDALFIGDPWVWLLAGAGVVAGGAGSAAGTAGWLALAAVLTVLIAVIGNAPGPAILLWLAGVVVVGAVRARRLAPQQTGRLATACLAGVAVYMLAMAAASRVAVLQVADWLEARGTPFVDIMAGPLPANPFVRDIVVADADHYHFLELDWLRADPIRVASPAVQRGRGDPIVAAALRAPQVQGIRAWLRFPVHAVEELADGYRVTIRDVRYTRRPGPSFPDIAVELDRALRPRAPTR